MVGILLHQPHLFAHFAHLVVAARMLAAHRLLAVGHETVAERHAEQDAHREGPYRAGDRESLDHLRLEARLFQHDAPALGQRVERTGFKRTLRNAARVARRFRRFRLRLQAAHRRKRLQRRRIDLAQHHYLRKGLLASEILGRQQRKHRLASQVGSRRHSPQLDGRAAVQDGYRHVVAFSDQDEPPRLAARVRR